jgi:hypothetical protein
LNLLIFSIQNSRYRINLKKDLINFTIYHFIYRGSTNMGPMSFERYHNKLYIEIWITKFAHTENILTILQVYRSNQIWNRFLKKKQIRAGSDRARPPSDGPAQIRRGVAGNGDSKGWPAGQASQRRWGPNRYGASSAVRSSEDRRPRFVISATEGLGRRWG